ncbi:LPS export ABC transporter periplasmic protein LptC [Mesorhizobium sp. Root157]|uniref:LPS export ABC transporter periplasmic protein LptC n=1 Tax=Mesorhizobium sp. Root157 TaxID=1736477 RepID=UPI000A72F3DC
MARSTKPASQDGAHIAPSANGDFEDGSAADRAAAFGRAQQHSRRVRRLKFVLPLVALAIMIAFPIYSYLVTPVTVVVKTDDSAFSDGKLVMANPKLEGFTKHNLPYAMTAVRAIQEVSKESVIALEGISARLPIDAETTAVVDASTGIYDREKNTLDLNSAITITTTDGMVAKLKSAFLDMGKGNMKTTEPVDISRAGSRITSQAMSVEDNGKVLIFEKRVRVNIDPAKAKAANKTSGEPNATQ